MRWKSRFDRTMLAAIFTLAWPTMLEQLTQTAVQYIDTAMVGSLGTTATAAVGATSTVNWMVGSIVAAVGTGFLAFIAQQIGAGRTDRARQASAQACLAALVDRLDHGRRRAGARVDAGRSRYPGYSLTVFQDSLSAHALPHRFHPVRNEIGRAHV